MQDDLLGYLLDSLEPEDRLRVAAELQRNPTLRRKLERWHELLDPLLAGAEDFEPPPGLAESVCQFVAQHAADQTDSDPDCETEPKRADREPAVTPSSNSKRTVGNPAPSATGAMSHLPSGGHQSWTLADLTVAMGIFLAAGLLLFPAIQQSRVDARVRECLRCVWSKMALITFASFSTARRIPKLPMRG